MAKRRIKNESFANLQAVVDAKELETVGQLDIVMADAVQENMRNENHVQEVEDELKNQAAVVTPETPEEPTTDVKNDFTAKLVLDESLNDFKLSEDAPKSDGRSRKVYDDDEEDEYLDYDMFDFVYGIVTDCWPKPLDPFGRKKYHKFMYIGSDKYKDSEDSETRDSSDGHQQVASWGDTIECYHNDPTYFDDVAQILDKYKIKYSGPNERRSKSSYWKYSWTIQIPCISSGYPYMVEEYFESIGLTMEDVMPAEFCKQYRKRQAVVEREAKKYINQVEVDKVIEKAITVAAQDNTEPLQTHLKQLYADLDAAGLTYQKSKVKKIFMDAFDDGDEDED